MAFRVAIAGSVDAVSAALSRSRDWLPADATLDGVVLIGEGGEGLPALSRAPRWDAIDFSVLLVNRVILADTLPLHIARNLLARAAAAGVALFCLETDGVRPLALNDVIGAPTPSGVESCAQELAGKRVLITGGGGSIGGAIARRIAQLGPAHLALLDSSELNLFNASHALPDAEIILADVRDEAAVQRHFERIRPDIVFHAAALKQVPLVEMFPGEGVRTNVCGIRNVADAAHELGADLIFLSTDKAADPSGVMGASKRLGELYCQALDRLGGSRAIPVRLGNVLGSAGSVAPLFEAQLASGGPLTVTDADVTRYFVSIPQAADALLRAAAAGRATRGQRGAALVIDMGEARSIVDLARTMIELSGQRPDIDVPIVFIGLRPGEKLHERLFGADEHVEPDLARGVVAATSAPRDIEELNRAIDRLTLLARDGDDEAVKQALFAAVAIAPNARETQSVG